METKNNAVQQEEKRSFKKISWSSVGYVAIAFLCAVALWFYVADYDRIVEREILDVPVELVLPNDQSLSVESGMDKYINVKVTGRKADVMNMTANDLRASVDVSGVKEETDRAFDVQVEVLREGVSVVDTRNIPSVTVVLVRSTYKDIKVIANIDYTIDEPNYIDTNCDPQYITVKGSASIVDSIYAAEVSKDVGKINGNISTTGKIVLKDASGNVIPQDYLEIDKTDVTVYIDAYTRKDLNVEVKFTGGVYDVATAGAEIKCNPSVVTVSGPLKSLENRTNVVIEVDEKQITESNFSAVLQLPDLSEHVSIEYENLESYDVEVAITQNLITSGEVVVHKDVISILESQGYQATIVDIHSNDNEAGEIASVIFRGYFETIRTISEQKIDFSVNLADAIYGLELDFSEGTAILENVPVNIGYSTLPGVFTGDDVYATIELSVSENSEDVESSEE